MLSRIDQMAPSVQAIARDARRMASDFTMKAKTARTFQASVTMDAEGCDAAAEMLLTLAATSEMLFSEAAEQSQSANWFRDRVKSGLSLADKLNAMGLRALVVWWGLNWRERQKIRRTIVHQALRK